jgi:hypothetical protein
LSPRIPHQRPIQADDPEVSTISPDCLERTPAQDDSLPFPPDTGTAPPSAHVAIIQSRYADLILSGVKRIESRMTKARGPAFERVRAGDTIYFKARGGGFRASARVWRALDIRDLTTQGIWAIRELLGKEIAADHAYWKSRRNARYATLLWLAQVREDLEGPALWRWPGFRDRSAWGSRVLSPANALSTTSHLAQATLRRPA